MGVQWHEVDNSALFCLELLSYVCVINAFTFSGSFTDSKDILPLCRILASPQNSNTNTVTATLSNTKVGAWTRSSFVRGRPLRSYLQSKSRVFRKTVFGLNFSRFVRNLCHIIKACWLILWEISVGCFWGWCVRKQCISGSIQSLTHCISTCLKQAFSV